MAPSADQVRQALSAVNFPGLSKDIVSFGLIEMLEVDGGLVKIRLSVPAGDTRAVEKLAREVHETASRLDGVDEVRLDVSAPRAAAPRPRSGAGGAALPTAGQSPPGGPPPGGPPPGGPPPGGPPPGGPPPGGPPPGGVGPGGPAPGGPALGDPYQASPVGGTPVGDGGRPEPLIRHDPIPGVTQVLAVASGKGGVGKSTVASNLALALRALGRDVGLMDADIYGPSIPTMFGLHEEPEITEVDGRRMIIPLERHGIKLMSLGFLQPEDDPVIWRGPLVMRAVRQFLRDVDWRGCETLVIDLPPGTGDAQLTLTQSAPLDGAVIVTTPQDVSLIDARKGLHMFHEVDVPVLGIVENMSVYTCPECGHAEHIFRAGGGGRTAKELGVPLLGDVPIDPRVAECGDGGTPAVIEHPDSEVAQAFGKIAEQVAEALTAPKSRPVSEQA